MKTLISVLLLSISCTSLAAEFAKFNCSAGSAGGCMASIKSNGKLIALMWAPLIDPVEEFMGAWIYAPDGEVESGHEYTLIGANGNTLKIGVVVDPTLKGRAIANEGSTQRMMTATRASDGFYSFTPLELIGIGKIVMKESPEKPGKFLVDIKLNP